MTTFRHDRPGNRSEMRFAAVLHIATLLLGTLISSMSAARVAHGDESARTVNGLLERMNRAIESLDYKGRFVYQHQTLLEAFYINHIVKTGREHERLVSLNGSLRQLVRDEQTVTCVTPRQEKTDVDRWPVNRRLSPLLAIEPEALSKHYEFTVGDRSRVAGRFTRDILINPRDDLRFGYRLSIDEEYALPLRTVMLNAAGRTISQTMFTELEVGNIVDDEMSDLDVLLEAASSSPSMRKRENRSRMMRRPEWTFARLPNGYMLNMHRVQAQRSNDSYREHFVFSDGLATVSVYVEPWRTEGLDGRAAMGPLKAFTRSAHSHHITVVGEVPEKTLELISGAMAPVTETND